MAFVGWRTRKGELMSAIVGKLLLASMVAALPVMAEAQTYTRTETITYHDNTAKWVLGQVSQATVNGVVASETTYNANAQPSVVKSFGKTVQTLTYNTDGTVATVKDGNNNVTTAGSWKRGIPQSIQYADGASGSAVVNDEGWITSVTDENGYVTGYGYDAMGRLASIVYPTADSTTWSTTTQAFVQVASSEYGIPAGHWQQTVSTGTGRKITYFDALWRPLVVREYDTANQAGTERFQRFAYDHEGRVTFASYPAAVNNPTTGTWTDYDALGRVVAVSQDSELGSQPLVTLTEYLSGNRIRNTPPRGHATTISYMAYDQPTYDWPVAIVQPEGAYTDIARDVFGKPTSITRRNNSGSVSVTRSYVYDANQQLCKSIEPETGAAVMAYDGAGNLSWSASGQSYPSTSSCDTASVASNQKVSRTYDARNRLKTLTFPDGRGNQTWTYTPDGLPGQISTNNSNGGDTAINAYTYNKRRLLTGEAVTQGGDTFTLGYGYTANGHLANHVYPSGLTVAYAPNALGQATRAGTYATGVSYYPNGAIKQFTYGNGIVHSMTQNARQLPARSTDSGGGNPLDLAYSYDANANVAAITDYVGTGRQTRSMAYDGLDRLLTTQSVMFGGDNLAQFSYDVLDNLKTFKVGTSRNYTYWYNAKQQLETVNQVVGGAAVVGLGYDVRGNLANKNGVLHQFDYGNRLREVTGQESYRYDGHGRRVKSVSSTLGDIDSFYDMGGALRYQRNARTSETNAYIHLGGSLVAKVTTSTLQPPDGAPTVTAPASSTTGSYTVSWTTVAAATSYRLEERKDGGGWSEVHNGSSASKALSGRDGGAYDYRARACNSSGCGGYSAVKSTTVLLPPASVPTVTTPASSATGSYTVSWTTVATATRYELQEQIDGGSWSLIQDAAGTSRAISGKGNGTYGYRVQACNSSGCGGYSAVSSTTVLLPPASAPTVTAPTNNTTGTYALMWTAVGTATSYQLEEQVDGGAWAQIYEGANTSRSISSKPNGTYGYRVRACNTSGCGPYSAVAQTVVVINLIPVNFYVKYQSSGWPQTTTYYFFWNQVAGATSYEITGQSGPTMTLPGNTAIPHQVSMSGPPMHFGPQGQYRIRSCNGTTCSAWSDWVTHTPL
ncbi:RHS repeat protein [Pseudoxanthomonas suwonensis]|nr:RHS repeat protein [Pseudoxanthomonas suwonensis]